VVKFKTAHWRCLFGIACLLVGLPGCANFWDELLSSERDARYIFNINKPDPLVVIRDNDSSKPNADGLRRAQALCQLREPLKNGGNAQDQDYYLKILGAAATTDREPLCRLAAIRALGKFQDQRAAQLLEEVFNQPKLPFTAENNSMIRRESLVALEQMHDPSSLPLLIRVARQPGPPKSADRVDRMQTQDEKTVAIRALAKYREQEAVDALAFVLKTEKDIALRHRAHQSLEESTGKHWPDAFEEWQKADVRPLPKESSTDETIRLMTSWWPK
jgi:HEAT repeat protein